MRCQHAGPRIADAPYRCLRLREHCTLASVEPRSLGSSQGAQLFFSFAARIFTCLLPQEDTREDYRVSLCQRSITPLPAAYD